MDEKDNTTLINPATIQLLNLVSAAEAYLLSGNIKPACQTMRFLIYRLHPNDQDISYIAKNGDKVIIADRLEKEIDFYIQVRSLRQKQQHTDHNQHRYANWLRLIQMRLHERGYLDGSNWKTANPSAGDKKSGKGTHKALPSVMSSRIEDP